MYGFLYVLTDLYAFLYDLYGFIYMADLYAWRGFQNGGQRIRLRNAARDLQHCQAKLFFYKLFFISFYSGMNNDVLFHAFTLSFYSGIYKWCFISFFYFIKFADISFRFFKLLFQAYINFVLFRSFTSHNSMIFYNIFILYIME